MVESQRDHCTNGIESLFTRHTRTQQLAKLADRPPETSIAAVPVIIPFLLSHVIPMVTKGADHHLLGDQTPIISAEPCIEQRLLWQRTSSDSHPRRRLFVQPRRMSPSTTSPLNAIERLSHSKHRNSAFSAPNEARIQFQSLCVARPSRARVMKS